MPLSQYTELTMEGLQKGEKTISSGASKTTYEKYEPGKEELVMQMYKMYKDNVQKK